MIVADIGPLIAFARLRRLPLLRQVVSTVLIPDAVFDEMVTRGRGRPGSSEVAEGTWIQRRILSHHEALTQFPAPLHAGEREAIHLTAELNVPLLITCEPSFVRSGAPLIEPTYCANPCISCSFHDQPL